MLLTALAFMAGCGTAPVRKEPEIPAKRTVGENVKPDLTYAIDAYDPWEGLNRRIYNFNAIFDNYVFLPVVQAYEFVLPVFVQKGITNFFKNLTEITNLTNSLLQFKFEKAVNTFGRILINTTVGVGGLIDVATHNDRIQREDEDFGQTLGFYGLGPGPYLVLPILGPSNLRDTGGLVVDAVVYSMMVSQLIAELGMDDTPENVLNYSLTGIYAIDKRHTEPFRYFKTGSPFEYDLIRKLYLIKRQFQIEN
jgi:phospholipid-binding lipoprotein MlaA